MELVPSILSNTLSILRLMPLYTTMTSRNNLFMRRATLGLLLLAHLFLQVQVAIACVVENLPGVPCALDATASAEHSQTGKTVGADCCQTAYQPASALYDAATPPTKDASLAAVHALAPIIVALIDVRIATPVLPIPLSNEASPPGVLGTDLYLTTLRLRI